MKTNFKKENIWECKEDEGRDFSKSLKNQFFKQTKGLNYFETGEHSIDIKRTKRLCEPTGKITHDRNLVQRVEL